MESVTLNPENQVVDLLAGMVKQWQTARRAKIFRLRTKIINGPKKRFKVASDGSLYRRSFDLQLREQWSASVVGDVTGDFCTRWKERESTWRKSWSCQSRGTSQSKS